MGTPFSNQPDDSSNEAEYLRQLFELMRQGGPDAEKAFEKFYTATYAKVWRFLNHQFGDLDFFTRDAAINSAFGVLWERIKSMEDAVHAVRYTKATARHCLFAMLKGRERQKSLGESWRRGFDKILDDSPPAWKELETKEIVLKIKEAIARLTDSHQAAVRAFMYHDSLVAAAATLSITPSAYREKLGRAFAALRRILQDDLGS